jgi:streptogramin lyase/putative cell wall-binding protein
MAFAVGFDGAAAQAAPTVTITEFSAGIPATANPAGIVVGPDGDVWFTESVTGQIARITPQGVVTQFAAHSPPGGGPANIALGPDGNLWFTEVTNAIGRITPAGVVTTFTAGITQFTDAIAAGSDGNMWFTEGHNMVGKITPAGVVTEYPGANGETNSITAGPDGNLWFATLVPSVGRVTTSGVVTILTAGIDASWGSSRITVGPDGALWFTIDSGGIGRITTSGAVTEYSADLAGTEPLGITTGPDGALWFTDFANSRIGRITTSGAVSLYSAGISAGAGPQAILTGPDGNLWFTEASGHRVGKVVIAGSGDAGTPALPAYSRISGADRIATAVAVSAREYPVAQSAQGVVLARADTFPDALAGGPLAASLHAPLLLTSATTLSAATESQIKATLAPGGTVTLLGGSSAISDAVAASITADGYTVKRYAGTNRDGTAIAIADANPAPAAILLADGDGFADALSAGSAAAHVDGVVLLTDGSTLSAAVRTYIAAHPGVPVYAVGGPAAAALPAAVPVVGADRYATSVAVAHKFFNVPTTIGLASGTTFPDALAGGVEMGVIGGPMLLVEPTTMPAVVGTYITSTPAITSMNVYGGPAAIADRVVASASSH